MSDCHYAKFNDNRSQPYENGCHTSTYSSEINAFKGLCAEADGTERMDTTASWTAKKYFFYFFYQLNTVSRTLKCTLS